jgi:hypothetical protein
MKTFTALITTILLGYYSSGQTVNNSVKLKDLAVPNSPAFTITDITPSLIQTPNTPKSFVLGLAQSFQQSTDGFPQNYSAEFAPYWWLKPHNRNVYAMLGIKTKSDGAGNVTSIDGENPFSGLKFTSFSIAFLNKDMIPDSNKVSQKIFSFGARATVIKIYLKGHSANLKNKINEWHDAAQKELEVFQEAITRADPKKQAEMLKQLANYKPTGTTEKVKEINDIINEKPILSVDIAAAYATYGINDSVWRSGRSGIWTTVSSYIPLGLGTEKVNKNYFNLNFSFRYLFDNYFKDTKGIISKNTSIDLGGKIALEFDQFSIAVESLYRFNNAVAHSQNRTLGIINYKITDNIYINGAFGKNFDFPNKLISLFGINWGFGSETVNLPK